MILFHVYLQYVGGYFTCATVQGWKPESISVGLVLLSSLCVGHRGGSQVVKLVKQMPLPAEPLLQPALGTHNSHSSL